MMQTKNKFKCLPNLLCFLSIVRMVQSDLMWVEAERKWQRIKICHFLSGALTAKLTVPGKWTYFIIDLRKASSAFFDCSSASLVCSSAILAFSSAILALSSAIFTAFSARIAAASALSVAASAAALAAWASCTA